jgi:hypothetical protein
VAPTFKPFTNYFLILQLAFLLEKKKMFNGNPTISSIEITPLKIFLQDNDLILVLD